MKEKGKSSLSRRQFLRASALAATGLAAVACAPQATSTPKAEEPAAGQVEPTATEASGPTPVPTAVVGEYGKSSKPVVMWGGLSGADGATFQKMLQNYTETNPDYAVRSETYVWDVLYQKLPTAIAAGTPPDMTVFHETEIEQFTRQGLLMPLDDIMYDTGLIPEDDFAPAVIEAVTVDGKKMCVPFDNHGWVCFINTKVIQDAGLDPENMPKNGTEFIDWAIKVTTDESGKHPDEDGFNPDKVKVWAFYHTWPRFTIPSTLRQFGTDLITRDRTKSLLDTPEAIAAVQYWYDLMYKYRVCPPAVPGIPWAGDVYKNNGLAVMWEGSWSLNFFRDNPDSQAVTKAMFLNSLAPDGKQSCKIGIHTLSIPTGVKEDGVKRASHLIKWLSDNGEFWATSGQVPARLSVQNSKTVQDGWSTRVAAEEFSKIGQPDVTHKAYTEIQQTWEAAVSAALANTQPLKEAMVEGSKQVQAILDRP